MTLNSSWLQEADGGVILRLIIQPRASKTQVVGLHGEPPRLKLRIAAPPVDGEANEEVLSFLKKALKATNSDLELVRGHTSKLKDVLCRGISAETARLKLLPVARRE